MSGSDDERFFYDNTLKGRWNDLQFKSHEFNVFPQPFIVLSPKTTPQSCPDRGILNPSSSFEFFLPPEPTPPMTYNYDSTSRYRPYVHWPEESISPSPKETPFTTIRKSGPRISLNTSLPFHSKLNIRIHAHRMQRNDVNENNQVKATATIQGLDPQYEHEYNEGLRKTYLQHYSTLSSDEKSRRNLPRRYEQLPAHRQISLPVSLPIDQRLFLYIHNGEVFARC